MSRNPHHTARPARVSSRKTWVESQSSFEAIPQAHAIALDETSRERVPLADIWSRLADGAWIVSQSFQSEQRAFFVARVVGEGHTSPGSGRSALLQRLLLCDCRKALAFELGMSQSTLAHVTAQCLERMGFPAHPAKAPYLLVLAASAQAYGRVMDARLSRISGGSSYVLVSAELPGLSSLSSAESEVTRRVLEGWSHEEISALRAASPRTVANQMNVVFRKMGVSGRAALLQTLAGIGERTGRSAARQDLLQRTC